MLRLAGLPVAALGRWARRPTPRRQRPGVAEPPRIVLIRPDHLGDVLLAAPVATVLHDALPGARIDWLVGPWSAEVARRAGGPGNVQTFDFPGFSRRPKRSLAEPYRLLVCEAARLRNGRYDVALVLRPDHWWGAMLAAAAGIPRRFGFSVAECQPFLTDTLPIPAGHAVRANQELAQLAARRLGGVPANGGAIVDPTFDIRPDESAWARAWLSERLGDVPGVRVTDGGGWRPATEPIVAIHPGSGAALKNWLPDRWVEVAAALREDRGARVFLTGGPGERDLVESIAAQLHPRPPTIVGETSLGQLAALFACSDIVLGCDSGPLHLAAAVGPQTVRLYGPTDTQEFGPWTPRAGRGQHWAISGFVPCQPCRSLVNPPCGATERPACMQAISADAVGSLTGELLDVGGPDPNDGTPRIMSTPGAS